MISVDNTEVPQQVDRCSISPNGDTIPKDSLSRLLDESYNAFNGTGYDSDRCDSASTITDDANKVSDRPGRADRRFRSILDAQAQTGDSICTWAASFGRYHRQMVTDDAQLRSVLAERTRLRAGDFSPLSDQIKPTLPVLLANMTTPTGAATPSRVGRRALVLFPPHVAQTQTPVFLATTQRVCPT